MNPIGGGIYAITHRPSQRMYVGSTCRLSRRKREHFSELRRGTHHTQYLQNAFNKYGAEEFDFDVIEFVENIHRLASREQTWIDFFKPGFNTRITAESNAGMRMPPRTLEHSAAISKANKGRPATAAQRAILLVAAKRPKSVETRARMADAGKGRVVSEETKQRNREAALKRWGNPEYRAKAIARRRAMTYSQEGMRRMTEGAKTRIAARQRNADGTLQVGARGVETALRISSGSILTEFAV